MRYNGFRVKCPADSRLCSVYKQAIHVAETEHVVLLGSRQGRVHRLHPGCEPLDVNTEQHRGSVARGTVGPGTVTLSGLATVCTFLGHACLGMCIRVRA
jgi:hypothetical protein